MLEDIDHGNLKGLLVGENRSKAPLRQTGAGRSGTLSAMINKRIAHYKITSKLGLRPEPVLSLTEAQRHRENRGVKLHAFVSPWLREELSRNIEYRLTNN